MEYRRSIRESGIKSDDQHRVDVVSDRPRFWCRGGAYGRIGLF